MTDNVQTVLRTIAIGAGATVTMDAWAALLRRFGVPSLNFALLGRWIGHLPAGRFFHANISQAAPIRGERVFGWLAHYAIGISFAVLMVATFGLSWTQDPTLAPALLVGVATVVAPLFVLQPALGFGVASSKTARPVFNALKSVTTHVIYGIGLYITAIAMNIVLIPAIRES